MTAKQTYHNRTAIVYFGATQKDYLDLVCANDRKPLSQYLQGPLQAQLSAERHKSDCQDTSRYTIHALRERQLQGWLGQAESIPICRIRCQSYCVFLRHSAYLHLKVFEGKMVYDSVKVYVS